LETRLKYKGTCIFNCWAHCAKSSQKGIAVIIQKRGLCSISANPFNHRRPAGRALSPPSQTLELFKLFRDLARDSRPRFLCGKNPPPNFKNHSFLADWDESHYLGGLIDGLSPPIMGNDAYVRGALHWQSSASTSCHPLLQCLLVHCGSLWLGQTLESQRQDSPWAFACQARLATFFFSLSHLPACRRNLNSDSVGPEKMALHIPRASLSNIASGLWNLPSALASLLVPTLSIHQLFGEEEDLDFLLFFFFSLGSTPSRVFPFSLACQ